MRNASQKEPGTKVCPRCGQVLFADMNVCYGCLYDFKRGGAEPPLAVEPPLAAKVPEVTPAPSTDKTGVFVREPEKRESSYAGKTMPTRPLGRPADAGVSLREVPSVDVRQEKARPMPFEDEDLMTVPTTVIASTSDRGGLSLRVRSDDMEVTLPLPEDGLLIGRGNVCDVILHSRAVSRHHVRIVPQGNGAIVRDCGSTNLATLNGREVSDATRMSVGETLDVCGTYFTLVDGPWS